MIAIQRLLQSFDKIAECGGVCVWKLKPTKTSSYQFFVTFSCGQWKAAGYANVDQAFRCFQLWVRWELEILGVLEKEVSDQVSQWFNETKQ